jgi:hypothetical protein
VDTSFQRLMTQGSETVMMRARIWAWAPDELKLRAWPKIRKSLEDQATAADLDPARAFPEPEGYVEDQKPDDKQDEQDNESDGNVPSIDRSRSQPPAPSPS